MILVGNMLDLCVPLRSRRGATFWSNSSTTANQNQSPQWFDVTVFVFFFSVLLCEPFVDVSVLT